MKKYKIRMFDVFLFDEFPENREKLHCYFMKFMKKRVFAQVKFHKPKSVCEIKSRLAKMCECFILVNATANQEVQKQLDILKLECSRDANIMIFHVNI